MRALPLAAMVALAACAEPATAPEHGKLWPHREAIAKALTFRKGPLSATVGKTVRPCIDYLITGNPDLAEISPALCKDRARLVRARLSRLAGVEATLDDVRDPALWRFVVAETKR